MKSSRDSGGLWSRFTFVLLCFFFSGITGLIYQILWVRMIEKVVGSGPFAIAIVLAVFMGGLGLGSYLASGWIDQKANSPEALVRIYGLLEISIGLYALLVPLLLTGLEPIYAWMYQKFWRHFLLFNLFTCAFCGLTLLVPTMFMGATLPLLCRYAVSRLETLATRTGLLYGLNTLGAALGAWMTGMVLLGAIGMVGTLAVGAVLNCLIGAACVLSAQARPALDPLRQPTAAKDSRRKAARVPEPMTELVLAPVLVIMAVSGFCSLAYEVILTKLLSLIVGPTTYSFTIVLVTFISGLAIGSVIFGRMGDKAARPDLVLLWSQLGGAVTMLLTSQFLGNSQFFFSKLLFTFQGSFGQQQGLKAGALFLFMFVPTMFLGATFPLAGKLMTRSAATVGRALGLGYAINTAGCVAGSLAAGFVLVPFLGKERGISVVVAIQIMTVLVGALLWLRSKPAQRMALAALAVIGLLACAVLPRWNHLHLSSSKYHRFQHLTPALLKHHWLEAILKGPAILDQVEQGKLLHYGEGVGGFTTVIQTADVFGNPVISMANSGKFDASTGVDMKTQVLSAHIPLLFHTNAELVMVVGLASGITGGEVLHYSSVKRLDIVEIGSQVVPGSRYFDEHNGKVLEQPRANLIIQDARAHLALSGASYDVIISEPSNPWMAGMASLFTENFFSLVKSRLRPGGIYVQFVHTYEIDWASFALVARTFAKTFPSSLLMTTHPAQEGADYLLVGFAEEGGRFDLAGARSRIGDAQRSRNVRLSDASLLYRLVVTEDLAALSGKGPVNTDNHPLLEFAAPRSLYTADTSIPKQIRERRALSTETATLLRTLTTDVEAQLAYADFAFSLQTPFAQMVDEKRATEAQQQRFMAMVRAYGERYPIDCSLFSAGSLVGECRRRQISVLERRNGLLDGKALAYLADLYYQSGRKAEARAGFEKVLAKDPNDIQALNGIGILHGEDSKFDEAIGYFERALRLNPLLAEPHLNMGITYLSAGKRDLAARSFKNALRLDPASTPARQGLQQSTSK